MSSRIPNVDRCCVCVTDLKTAVVLIAVIGIVTCPAVQWAVVRHTYMVRMSCVMTTRGPHPDVVDINFHYVLSFGFGPNAGMDNSFLNTNSTSLSLVENKLKNNGLNESKAYLVENLRYYGGIVFLVDLVFMISCIIFLVKVFRAMDDATSKFFMNATIVSTVLSYAYGMFFVYVCVSIGAGFPILEFIFATADIIVWAYFIVVIRSYRNTNARGSANR